MKQFGSLNTLFAIFLATGVLGPVNALGQDSPAAGNSPAEVALHDAPEALPTEVDEAELRQQAMSDKSHYEAIIDSLSDSSSQNSYNPELVEAYLGLAASLETLEQYEEASTVYDQALQAIRINNGLDDPGQIPVLDRLEGTLEKRGNWEEMDTYEHLIFHIARRNYDIGDDRRFETLDRLGKWKLRVANEELLGNPRDEARQALMLYKNELEQLEEFRDYPRKPLHQAKLLLGEARANLVISELVLAMPISDFRTTGQQTITTQRCRMVRLGNGRTTQICETVEVPNLDYYIDPSARKFTEINQNRLDIRRSIMEAWNLLQINEYPEDRDRLLTEVLELTESYNAFVTDNSL